MANVRSGAFPAMAILGGKSLRDRGGISGTGPSPYPLRPEAAPFEFGDAPFCQFSVLEAYFDTSTPSAK
jgi:hypothetical protein